MYNKSPFVTTFFTTLLILAQSRKGACSVEKYLTPAGAHPQLLMTLRISANAASQICLLADTSNDLAQIISENEDLRCHGRAIFKTWKRLMGGGLGRRHI